MAMAKSKPANAGDKIRDIINWLAVFKEEYDLSDEVVDTLRDKLEDLAKSIGK